MSLNKRLIAGGAGTEYYGGEFTWNTVQGSTADIDVTTGVKPDFLFMFVKPGHNNTSLTSYSWIFDKHFLTTKQMARDNGSWYSDSNNDVISWNDDGVTMKYVNTGNNRTDLYYMDNGNTYYQAGLAFRTSDTGVTNTDGDITSTVYVNSDANISKVSWTSNGSSGYTVGHGLGVTPEVIIFVKLNNYSTTAQDGSSGDGSTIRYDSNAAAWRQEIDQAFRAPDGGVTNATANSSTFNVGSASDRYGINGQRIFCYCFASKSGFSKHQSYVGNASATTRTVASTDFNPISIFAMGDLHWYAFTMESRTSGSIGSLPRWDSQYCSNIYNYDGTATLGSGGYVRADHRTNKRVLFNTSTAEINGSSDYNGILTFGGDNWWHPEI